MHRRTLLRNLATYATTLLSGKAFSSQHPISLLVHPFDNPRRLFARFHPMTTYLSQATHQIKLNLLTSYQQQLDMITCQKQENVAYLGPSTFHLARQLNPNIKPLAMETIGGKTHFRALLLTQTDSGIFQPKDVIRRRFAVGDELSLGSTLYPRYWLKRADVETNQLLSWDSYKNHDQILQALLHQQADIGCVREDIAQPYLSRGLRVIDRSEPLPPHIVVASSPTDTSFCHQISQRLIFPDSQGEFAIRALGKQHGFTHYDANAYDFMQEIFQTLSEDISS